MSKGIQKKILRNNLREEENEVKNFERERARIMQAFNDFMFGNEKGSFIQFDLEYRKLAKQDYKFLKPNETYFYEFAIDNEDYGKLNTDNSPKFNWPIGFEKASNTEKVQR